MVVPVGMMVVKVALMGVGVGARAGAEVWQHIFFFSGHMSLKA